MRVSFILVPSWLFLATAAAPAASPPHFSREVLPILSDNCFACHGHDEKTRKAGLRLDTREGALAKNEEGLAAIVPGNPGAGELIKRISSADADEVMPPPKSHKKPLDPRQVGILKDWIAAGAPWGKHWSLEKPIKPVPPAPAVTAAEAANPIDAFVLEELRHENLTLSPAAPPHTLARRLAFDLTGLPPDPEDAATLKPAAIGAYIDKLLASEHFGERMAMWWLDAARYSDTDGFQADDTRTNWPWRDWVAAAFNHNLPFDQFTIEQFAGDLLPNATPEQKLATCFHRNHMTNGEGGRDPEESRVDYVRDRVNTLGTVWLGLTLGCCQCHSHKFDPVSQTDYYSLTAFFNSIDEDGKAGKGAKPYFAYQSPLAPRAVGEAEQPVVQRRPAEEKARADALAPFEAWLAGRLKNAGEEPGAWRVVRASALETSEGTTLAQEPGGSVQATGPNPVQDEYRLAASVRLPRITGLKLEVLPHPSHTNGSFSRGKSGEFILTDFKLQVRRRGNPQVRDIKIVGAVADVSGEQKGAREYGDIKGVLDDDPRNGWTTKGHDPRRTHTAVFALEEPLVPADDEELVFHLLHRSTLGDANIGRFRLFVTDQRGPAIRSAEAPPLDQLARSRPADVKKLDAKLRTRLFDQFLEDHAPYTTAKAALDRAKAQLAEAKAAAGKLSVMVLAERRTPRETHVLLRGDWEKKGEPVRRDVPAAIAPWNGGEGRSRLDLAKWIVSPDNPLTARVIVNHLWQICFGAGLVRTVEDFGIQGERPTHPELLDWLACEFVESEWDVKHLLTLIASSRTYQQRSEASPTLIARDPENRLLARGARFRLPSWMLRDAALSVSGLLNPAVGGPPVRPYQPDGVWEENFMGRFRYEASEGAAQYRRTLYAFWRRAVSPTFLFDSAQRRVCEVRLPRTNTPLQALTLLNDATQLEAARRLADLALQPDVAAPRGPAWIFRRVLGRDPRPEEVAILSRELERARARYQAEPNAAARFVQVGQTAPVKAPAVEVAAHMVAASMILNLDETLNHE